MTQKTMFATGTLVLMLICALMSLGQSAAPVQYFYDDLGRLTRVVDPSGNVATYTYDAVGNILKITRSTLASSTTLAILSFSPAKGGIGATVTIQGQGFNPTASLNTVSFNGATAPVVSATSSSIVVTVPSNAGTGPITVTTGGQTATSDAIFTFIPGPAILSVTPKSVLSGSTATGIPNFQVTGTNLNTATFAFQPATTPPQITVGSVSIGPSGSSATLGLLIAANASGAFALVATNASGSSSQVPSSANAIHLLISNGDDDNDGLTNAVEIAVGTDPVNASTAGDGISDGWKVFYGFDPLSNIAAADSDGDGLTNLQEFQAGTDPRNPDTAPPSVSQVFPANLATAYPLNGRVVVRFAEPLLTGVSLTSAQSTINRVAPSLPAGAQAAAAAVLQSYLQATCCNSSVNPAAVSLTQNSVSVAGSVIISNDGLSLTFTPSQPLLANTVYTVQSSGVRDLAGNLMTAAFQSSFTTGAATDLTGPTIVQTSPVDGGVNVPTNAAFTVQFSKRIDPATLPPQAFTVTDTLTNITAPGTVQVDASGLTAAFVPNPPLPVGRSFSVRLDPTRVKDTSGNALTTGNATFRFTTAFAPDADNPHLVATSPLNGDSGIPTNALIVLQFNEPLNTVFAASGVQVSAGGVPVQGGIALSNSNTLLTFTPAAALPPNTTYTVSVQPSITDTADRLIDNPGSFTFQTGAGADLNQGSITSISPLNGVVGVPVNAVMEAQFSKRMNPLTMGQAGFVVQPVVLVNPVFAVPGTPVAGSVVMSPGGLSATFTPSAPLVPGTLYQMSLGAGLTDLTGKALTNLTTFSFTTGTAAQGTGPAVIAVSPASAGAGVPVNARVAVRFNEALEPLSAGPSAIVVSTGGIPVAGTISLSGDRAALTFTPSSLLAVSTTYTVTVSGVEDVAGNAAAAFTSNFTTGASGVADTAALTVTSVNPANNATGVVVNSPVTLTFNKAVNPTTVNLSSILVQVPGVSGQLAGSYTVSGNVVTFTPVTALPGTTRLTVVAQSPLQDLAGNAVSTFSSAFTTATATDTVAPRVVSVTPPDGATNIGQFVSVVLTLNKSVNPATVVFGNNLTVGLLDGSGAPVSASVSISADNQTIILRASGLPPGTIATVVATSGVKDLAGNPLVDFRSQFTVTQFDTTHASVVTQRPGTGATGVGQNSSVVLYVNEALNPATVAGALHVSQNGVLSPGAVTVRDNGQTIQFVPSAPWQKNALVQLFLDGTALDSDGNAVNSYQGSFRTVADTVAIAPQVVNVSPTNINHGAVLPTVVNPVLEWQYNEPLNPNTVNANSVLLQQNVATGLFVAGTVTLDAGGTFIRFVPTVPLSPNTSYAMQTTAGITGTNGLPQNALNSFVFSTGSVSDTTPPVVTLVSPPDGSIGVPVNALVHVRFNEPVNPLTVSPATIQISSGTGASVAGSISFSNSNQDVVFTPQDPLPDATPMTIKIAGVEDIAGNQVLARTTQFTTGNGPAATQPVAVSENPNNGGFNVPLNAPISVRSSVPLDPGTVSPGSWIVTDGATNTRVTATTTLSPDGLTATFLPSAPLGVERFISVSFSSRGMTDLAGNLLTCSSTVCDFTFTTGTAASTQAPSVAAISPSDQLTAVPINARVVIQFNEPVNALTLSQIALSGPAGPVNAVATPVNDHSMVVLTPVVPLIGSAQYTVTVAGVQDLSGNTMAAAFTSAFTTAPGADLNLGSITSISPLNGVASVPVNAVMEAQFSKRMNPVTMGPAGFLVQPLIIVNPVFTRLGTPVAGSVVMSPDGLSATFTPSAPLVPGNIYGISVGTGLTDLAGQTLTGLTTFSFTTGTAAQGMGPAVIAVSPANAATSVPVNARVAVRFNEALEPLSVGPGAIAVSAGGTAVAGTINLSGDRTVLTFTPGNLLAASTIYTVTISGVEDVAGNVAGAFTSSFTTGTSTVADTTALTVSGVSPANNATGVAVSSPVVLTFNKAVNPTTVSLGSILVQASGIAGQLAGSYAVNGNIVTFTPTTALPGNTRLTVVAQSPLQDVAGNGMTSFSSVFTTGTGVDTIVPRVVSVTPPDGATNIGQNISVVLTLNKSVNPATVAGPLSGSIVTVGVLDGSGTPLQTSVAISADNQTITLTPAGLTAGTQATVVMTSGVKDLAGNAMTDFRSQFTVATQFDTTHASVVTQRPGNGATGVSQNSSVVLYVNETLNPATIAGALHVSQNGVLVAGTLTVRDNGQTLQFVPATPFQKNALVQVFLDGTALDSDGNTVNSYQGSFRTVADTTALSPQVVSVSPNTSSNSAPLNSVMEWQYNEPLNPNTVNTNTVLLRNNATGQFVAGAVALDASATFIRFVPTVPLTPNTSYTMQTTAAITGTNGLQQSQSALNVFTFSTGTVSDTTPPVVTLVSPPDGFSGVPVNALVHLRFNEPVNPLTVSPTTIQISNGTVTSVASSISFSNNNQDVVFTPQDPLPDATPMTITIVGVEDIAGNQVLARTTQFTTGNGPATTPPVAVSENPNNGAFNVPLNALISMQSSAPVDPGSVSPGTVIVTDSTIGQGISGSTSVGTDDQTVNFLPGGPLTANHGVSVRIRGITDLAGNLFGCCDFNFTAGTATDTQAPSITGVSPADQLTGVPINARVVIQFNEPVDGLTLSQVTLASAGGPVSVVTTPVNGNTLVILTPVVPLIGSTQYTLNVAGAQDLSGNTLSAPFSSSFTTAPGADLNRGSVTAISPANSALGVPVSTVITAQFSKRMNPLTMGAAGFVVQPVIGFGLGAPIAGTITMSPDGQNATFTPSVPLAASTTYSTLIGSGVTDLTGQALTNIPSFSFKTAP